MTFLDKERNIIEGTYLKFEGMYIGEQNNPSCKENHNILITMQQSSDWSDKVKVFVGYYKRNTKDHKKGDPKYREYLKRYPIMTLQQAWKKVNDYPTVSYGLCNSRRECIIIDSDKYYSSIEEARHIIDDNFSKLWLLPKASYVLRNPKTGHCQFGWWLDKPFYKNEFDQFNSIIKIFATAYKRTTSNDGDICFNGPACKNPYYVDFEKDINEKAVLSKENITKIAEVMFNQMMVYDQINTIKTPSFITYYNNTVVTKEKYERKSNMSKSSLKKHKFGSEETSRDANECRLLREYIWKYMREHNGVAPNREEARKEYDIIAIAAAKKTNKSVHSRTELNNTFDCTYKWAVSHFVMKKEKGDKKGAAFGRFIQELNKYIWLAEVLKYEDKTTREVADILGCSATSVSRYRKQLQDKEYLNKVITDIECFNEWCDKHAVAIEYSSMRNALNNAYKVLYKTLFSYMYYNNTVVTNNYQDIEDYLETKENIHDKTRIERNDTSAESNSLQYDVQTTLQRQRTA